ncbi:hypothetical protein HDE_01521 [Halotydeus destructor]|nr:hypothetical protein HDE_01521 [Halotydeus destructor]
MSRQDAYLHTHNEALIGIKQMVDLRTESVTSTLKAMEAQVKSNTANSVTLREFMKGEATRTAANDYMLANFIAMSQMANAHVLNYILIEEAYMDWYEAIVFLRDGFLPFKLVPYQRLKDLLVAVQIKLPSHLELAFEHSEWHMLYTLPLCKFTVEGENIFIRLSIPLRLKDMAVKYNLIIPMTSEFPCGSEVCKARPNRTDYFKFTGFLK